jgi:hypothetical protein
MSLRGHCPVKAGGFDDAARAAIAAMREPTDGMIAEGAIWADERGGEQQHCAAEGWRAMIDEALK